MRGLTMVCYAKVLYPGFLPFCTVGTLANPHQACNAFVLYHDSLSRLTFMQRTNLPLQTFFHARDTLALRWPRE